MVMLNFDATTVEPSSGGGGQLPVSDSKGHLVVIRESEMRATSKKDGEMLVLTLEMIEGEAKGTTGEYRLNLRNPNAQAQSIAQQQLSAICHVTGVYRVQDSSQLHNIPFRALVRLQKGDEAKEKGYTEIYGVNDANGNKPGKAGSPAAAPQTAGQAPAWAANGGTATPSGDAQNAAPWGQNPAPAQQAATGASPSNAPAGAPPWATN